MDNLTGHELRRRREASTFSLLRAISPARQTLDTKNIESLEGRIHLSVSQDANGWTVVTPSPGERIIYVSNEGSDSNTGLSSTSPIKSFTKAESLLQNGQPNQILLKSGDTFTDSFQNWKYSGLDAQDPILISYYGTGARPIIYTGTAGTGFSTPSYSNTGTVVNYLDVLGLVFDANLRDPTLGTVSTSFAGEQTGFYFYAKGGNVLVEDCSFSYYRYNFDIEAIAGTYFTTPSITNFTIRRTVDENSYAFSGGRSQGLYAYNVSGLTIQQSVFDHDGWNSNLYLGASDIGYNHDIYIASSCSGINISNNIIAEASYAGIMARAGGTINGNLFIGDAVAVSFGSADGADSKPGGVSGSLIGNTVVGDKASQTITYNSSQGKWVLGPGLAFGQGFVIANTAPGADVMVAGNVFTQDSQNAKPAIQLEVPTGTSNPSAAVGINDLFVENNVVNGWRVGIQTDGRFVPGGSGLYALNNLHVSQNAFINASTEEVRHDGAFATTQEFWTGDLFYDTVLKQSNWITLQSAAVAFSTWQSTYDFGAKALSSLPYNNPYVSIASYDASISGPGTVADFLTNADQLSINHYLPQYTALGGSNYAGAVSYILTGFNISSGFVNGPGTPPTAAALTTNVNVSSTGPNYIFTVNYTDGDVLNTSSLGNKNLLVAGPNGYSQYATYISAATPTIDTGGYQHTAVTYSIPLPTGGWTASASGVYTIDLLPNQVTDAFGNVASDAVIGSFTADLVLPTAVATVSNLTSSAAGTATYGFSVTYADASGIDTSTLSSYQVQVTGPNSYSSYATLTGQTTASNGSVVATYTIPAPGGSWSSSANGTYTVSMPANAVYSLSGNPVAAGVIATFNANISSPTNPVTGTATISGSVFIDSNGNGIFDPRESGLAGVQVFLDLAGTGVFATGDPTATTDVNGAYSFTNLPAGSYSVIEVAPAGYQPTSPSSGTSQVTLTTGQTRTVNFANQISNAVVSGNSGSTTPTTGGSGSTTTTGNSGSGKGRGKGTRPTFSTF